MPMVDLLRVVSDHLDRFVAASAWPDSSWCPGLWWANVRMPAGGPASDNRDAGIAKRCYRFIESPGGSNLLWDLPVVVACQASARTTGHQAHAEAAGTYVRAYLAAARSGSGLPFWGNHYYLHHDLGGPVWFHGGHQQVDPIIPAQRLAPLHETRPVGVPWDLLFQMDREATTAALCGHDRHMVTAGPVGCFNRHADGRGGEYAFLEAGGILAEALAARSTLLEDPAAAGTAAAVLRFSAGFTDASTGLVPISPLIERWDRHHCTSEVGMWAGCAMATGRRLADPTLAAPALAALAAWLELAWNPGAGRFAGRLRIADGGHDRQVKSTIYQPGTWSDPWNSLFPSHDYPLPCAEACLTAWQQTGDERFRQGLERWLQVLASSLPANNGIGACAEAYGRAIHVAWAAGRHCARADWTTLAEQLVDESLATLAADGWLRSHPGEDRCDAVDGLGWLLLAYLAVASDREPDLGALHW